MARLFATLVALAASAVANPLNTARASSERDVASSADTVLARDGPPSAPQMVAIASYINPTSGKEQWDRMIGYDTTKVSVLVANVVNGPDVGRSDPWHAVIANAGMSGKYIIGYVRTGYLGVSQQQFKTRLGSTEVHDWIAQIEMDVDLWYSMYGDNLRGIFFDEGWNECGPNNIYANVYAHINRYVKTKYTQGENIPFTVLNPGGSTPQCFEDSMDTLLTFEGTEQTYLNKFTDNGWPQPPKSPSKIWHIVHTMTSSSNVPKILSLAGSRYAGMIQITNEGEPNPYDQLPPSSYLDPAINGVSGGKPVVEKPAPFTGNAVTPSDFFVTSSEYTSISFGWDGDASVGGYNVFMDGNVVASLPSYYTATTIGNLAPGSSHTFYVVGIGAGNTASSPSKTITKSTDSLPGDGKTITNLKATVGYDGTKLSADVYVPYAFIRAYVWKGVDYPIIMTDPDLPGTGYAPGYPVYFGDKKDRYVSAKYMVEGSMLHQYAGKVNLSDTNPSLPWTWADYQEIPVTQSKYTWTWTLPFGTNRINTAHFAIQGEGYNNLTNVLSPDPSAFSCKGSIMCGIVGMSGYCKSAVDFLDSSNSPYLVGQGNCRGKDGSGCGVFTSGGENCGMSGPEMQKHYQDLKDIGGCSACGSYTRPDGCVFKADYVYQCDGASGT